MVRTAGVTGGTGNGAAVGAVAGPLGGPTTAVVPVVGGGAGNPGGLAGQFGPAPGCGAHISAAGTGSTRLRRVRRSRIRPIDDADERDADGEQPQRQHAVVRVAPDRDGEPGVVGLDPEHVIACRFDVDRFDRGTRRRSGVVADSVVGFEFDVVALRSDERQA